MKFQFLTLPIFSKQVFLSLSPIFRKTLKTEPSFKRKYLELLGTTCIVFKIEIYQIKEYH